LNVPADYDDPSSERFDIAVIRHPARNPQARIGSLVINNGGPGESPVSYLINNIDNPGEFGQAILDRFDLVGFDPRGVLRSRESGARQQTLRPPPLLPSRVMPMRRLLLLMLTLHLPFRRRCASNS
jgi:hypothetical protein